MAKDRVQQTTPYTAGQAVRAVARHIRDKSSGVVAAGARRVARRGSQVDRSVDEVQERHVTRR